VKNLLENKEMNFKNWVKNMQNAGYNGARAVVGNFDFVMFRLKHVL
jgi:hypothetical protein